MYFLHNLEIDSTSNVHPKYPPDPLFLIPKMQKVPGVGGENPLPPEASILGAGGGGSRPHENIGRQTYRFGPPITFDKLKNS